jgi:hypothetical protein
LDKVLKERKKPKPKKDKNLSLHPMTFDEALKKLLDTKPEKKEIKKK